ncbi:hypothetical protein FJ960_08135 [Mesorhizobium sp. B2-3-11]|uniref:hypothetical protein n=1 Tax=Mesorhizobium sp. B2-3-11 TaxID=2589953 RepID=UPI001129EF35|nr:hypothetical protein [Mesorhizobium sp. B2-3-11]TPM07851.1 hypothetical protein FJ960_08135 [Mesorhizobium sp. B2-3-11]
MDKLFTTQDIGGTKGEKTADADLSPIRSGFGRNVNINGRDRLLFLNVEFRKINDFTTLSGAYRSSRILHRQRLMAKSA